MNTEDLTPRIELTQEQVSKAPPIRPTVQNLQAAALDLYDVALRARDINALVLALLDAPTTGEISSELRIKVMVFDLVAAQAIAKAEVAL